MRLNVRARHPRGLLKFAGEQRSPTHRGRTFTARETRMPKRVSSSPVKAVLLGRCSASPSAARGATRRPATRTSSGSRQHDGLADAGRPDDRAAEGAAHDRRDDVRHRRRRAPTPTDTIMNVVGGTGSVAAPHVPGDLVRHPGHRARVLRAVQAAGEQLPDHRVLRPVVGSRRATAPPSRCTWTRSGKTFDHYFWVYGTHPVGRELRHLGRRRIAQPHRQVLELFVPQPRRLRAGDRPQLRHDARADMAARHRAAATRRSSTTRSASALQHKEYGNSLSFMGGGARHPSAVHKYHQGWMSGCNLVKVGASTTITLLPQELPCDGAQLLQIPAPKTRAGAGIARRSPGLRPDADALLPRDARRRTASTAGSGRWCWCRSVRSCRAANAERALRLHAGHERRDVDAHRRGAARRRRATAIRRAGSPSPSTRIDNTSANVTITTNGTGALTCGNNTAFTAPGPGRHAAAGRWSAAARRPASAGTGGGTGGRGGAGGAAGPAAQRVRQAREEEEARQARPGEAARPAAVVGGAAGGAAAAGGTGAAQRRQRGSAGTGSGGTGTAGSGTGAGGTIATGTGGTIVTGTGGSGRPARAAPPTVPGHGRQRRDGHGAAARRPRSAAAARARRPGGSPSGPPAVLGLLLGNGVDRAPEVEACVTDWR